MGTLSKSSKDLRYRAYFWLMDASLVALIIGGLDFLARKLFGMGSDYFLPSSLIFVIGIPLLILNFVVPMFLVVARFMRDDYTEQLWKRTFVVLAYFVALLPFIYLVLYWSLFFALGQPKPLPVILALPELNLTLGTAVYFAWIAYMMMFVVIFQFLRWRDSR